MTTSHALEAGHGIKKVEGYAHDSVDRPRQLRGRGNFDPTPRQQGPQGPLRKAHGSAAGRQKPVKLPTRNLHSSVPCMGKGGIVG
ncbi:hypothetical protein GCM10011408_36320 [Dyella caseinilytica]|nr:hypothetical protein GCM10011408_36320 [Dyella caseinilytica]